ncbi:MAG: uracil-DNA glycosylase family protein [Gemmatimonadetes bacterium]|nr:uracil-DNA glycosylase family protein [Gemmatimonadota bacterium]
MARDPSFRKLHSDILACEICAGHLPLGPRPVLQIHPKARVLIAGQAPGSRVHATGVPFQDPSGKRLREWMGIGEEVFYDEKRIAILPMGFCFPGTGKSGDLPPRPECAEAWREAVLAKLVNIEFTIVLGKYAQDWHLAGGVAGDGAGGRNVAKRSVTDVVADWKSHWPQALALPHPSPRNQIWLRKNPWFGKDVLPRLKRRVGALI